MRKTISAASLLFGLAAIAFAGPNVPVAERVGGLINQLGSGVYRERTDAFRELDVLGEAALDKLREAARSADSETAHRATELVRRIEHRLNSARILVPSLVEVEFTDKPVPEAVREFQNKTGLAVTLTGNTSQLGKRKVTYKSGRVTVWEALAGFCKAANLNEWNGLTPVPGLPAPSVASEQQANQVFMPQGRVMLRSSVRNSGAGTASQVFLYDESPIAVPTHHAGAVRIRALPVGTPIPNMTFDSDETIIPLQLTLEPRLSWAGTPSIKIGHATDDRDQKLLASVVNVSAGPASDDDFIMMQMMVGSPYGNQLPQRSQYLALRLRQGEKQPRNLKELSGALSLPLRVTGPIFVATDPLKSAGQIVRSPYGSMTIHSIEQKENGEAKVDVALELSPEVQLPMGNVMNNRIALMPNAQVQVQNGVIVQNFAGGLQNLSAGQTDYMGLSLSDATGKRFNTAQVAQQQMSNDYINGWKARMTVIFRPAKDSTEPAQLTFTASHPATVETDFRFADLPLP